MIRTFIRQVVPGAPRHRLERSYELPGAVARIVFIGSAAISDYARHQDKVQTSLMTLSERWPAPNFRHDITTINYYYHHAADFHMRLPQTLRQSLFKNYFRFGFTGLFFRITPR